MRTYTLPHSKPSSPRSFRKALVFLFSPRGWGDRILGVLCFWGGLALAIGAGFIPGKSSWIAFFLIYLCARSFSWIRWYPLQRGRAGIEDHFDKTGLASIWLTFFAALAAMMFHSPVPLYLAMVPLGIFVLFNFFMVLFHIRDQDPMAANSLSGHSRVF